MHWDKYIWMPNTKIPDFWAISAISTRPDFHCQGIVGAAYFRNINIHRHYALATHSLTMGTERIVGLFPSVSTLLHLSKDAPKWWPSVDHCQPSWYLLEFPPSLPPSHTTIFPLNCSGRLIGIGPQITTGVFHHSILEEPCPGGILQTSCLLTTGTATSRLSFVVFIFSPSSFAVKQEAWFILWHRKTQWDNSPCWSLADPASHHPVGMSAAHGDTAKSSP